MLSLSSEWGHSFAHLYGVAKAQKCLLTKVDTLSFLFAARVHLDLRLVRWSQHFIFNVFCP